MLSWAREERARDLRAWRDEVRFDLKEDFCGVVLTGSEVERTSVGGGSWSAGTVAMSGWSKEES